MSDNELEVHRFFCDCNSTEHIIELNFYKDNNGTVELCYYAGGKCGRGLWDRIKMAFGLIFKKDAPSWSEFIISDEDRAEIAELILNKRL
jgi:hypothetical protein